MSTFSRLSLVEVSCWVLESTQAPAQFVNRGRFGDSSWNSYMAAMLMQRKKSWMPESVA